MNIKPIIAVTFIYLAVFSFSAQAQIIKYQFSGVITKLDEYQTSNTGIELGTSWEVMATYSGDGVADTESSSDSFGSIANYALLNYSLKVGSVIDVTYTPFITGDEEQTVNLEVSDSIFGGNVVSFKADYLENNTGSISPLEPVTVLGDRQLIKSSIGIGDNSRSQWVGSDLSNSFNIDLNNFNIARIEIHMSNLNPNYFKSFYRGSVDSYEVTAVPLPSTAVLFLSGLIFIAKTVKRRY